jgi:VWFA-related protein
MCIASRLNLFLVLVLLSASHIAAQQIDSGAHPGERIYLDAVMSPASGPPVSNLQQQDFAIFDNDVPQTITSFEIVDARHAQIEVIVVLDALTASSRVQATALADIKRFLNAAGGELAYPTTVDFVTAKGLEFEAGPSRDGKAVGASLNKHAIAIRNIEDLMDPRRREKQFAVSFQAFAELVALERDKPGRKIILWISPGWPPIVPPDFDHNASKKQVQQVRLQMFGNIVQLTRQLHEGQITVYSIGSPDLADFRLRIHERLHAPEIVPMATRMSQESVRQVRSAGMISDWRHSPSEAAAWRFTRAMTLPRVFENASPTFPLFTNSPSIPCSPMSRTITTN